MIKLSPRARRIGKYVGVAIVASIGTIAALIAVQSYYRAEEVAINDMPVMVEPKPMPIITSQPGVTYNIKKDTVVADKPVFDTEYFTGWVVIDYMPGYGHQYSKKSHLWSLNCRAKSGRIISSVSIKADTGEEIEGLDVINPEGLFDFQDNHRKRFPPGSIEDQIITELCR